MPDSATKRPEGAQKPSYVTALQLFGDYLLMLLVPTVLAIYYYGTRVLAVAGVSVGTAVLTEAVLSAVLGRSYYLRDLTSVYSALCIALMLPAGVPLYIPVLASLFAIAAVKIPLGGSGAPIMPAAAGFAFAAVCFRTEVFTYTLRAQQKLLGAQSLGALLGGGNAMRLNAANLLDVLGGNVAGPLGTGCGLLMLACGIYLLMRRPRALLATAGFLGACILWTMLLPRSNGGMLTNIVLELCSGSLLFAAIFLVTDHATLPAAGLHRVLYGVLCGVLCMAMRRSGVFEEPVCFAIVLGNALRPVLESILPGGRRLQKKEVRA